jgi:hypothetical protein
MAAFAAAYTPFVSVPIYRLYPVVVSRISRLFTAGGKPAGKVGQGLGASFLDNSLHSPFLAIPSFYAITGSLRGDSAGDIKVKLENEWWTTLKATWLIWVPAQALSFAVLPAWQRPVFSCCMSFFYNITLSWISNRKQPTQLELKAAYTPDHTD